MKRLGALKKRTDFVFGTQHMQRCMAPMLCHDHQFSFALRPSP